MTREEKSVVLAFGVAGVIIAAVVLLFACNQQTRAVNPDNGVWIKCPSGGFCERSHEVCGEKGHACDENSCCEVGDNGFVFSAKRRPMSGRAGDAGP